MPGNQEAADPMISTPTEQKRKKPLKRGGSETQFPGKLHDMMTCVECEGLDSIVSWIKNGTAFMVHNPEKLLKILPIFFGQTKYRSFERQLNGWHFERILDGPDKGAFMHPYFVRGNKFLCTLMTRNFSPKPISATLMMNPVTESTLERTNLSHWTPRLLDYCVKPVEKPAHNDVSTSSDFAHFSKPAPAANLWSDILHLSSNSKVGHDRGDSDNTSSGDLQAGSPNEKATFSSLWIPPMELQDPTMMDAFIPTPIQSHIFPPKLTSPTLMMNPVIVSTSERISFSNWTPRLLDYSVNPIKKPAHSDVSTSSDFAQFSKLAPTTRMNLSSDMFGLSSNSKVGHHRGDCHEMSFNNLPAGSPREKAILSSLLIPPMELQDPTMMDAFIPTPIEEVSCHAGLLEPASPEAIESIFRELSGFNEM
jgi:hypothetical protein